MLFPLWRGGAGNGWRQTSVNIYICIYVYVYMSVYLLICICIFMYMYMYVHLCVYMCLCIYVWCEWICPSKADHDEHLICFSSYSFPSFLFGKNASWFWAGTGLRQMPVSSKWMIGVRCVLTLSALLWCHGSWQVVVWLFITCGWASTDPVYHILEGNLVFYLPLSRCCQMII